MILITGSEGLIGKHLSERVEAAGVEVRGFDIRRSKREDTRNPDALAEAVEGVQGIVHLAAVSRVVLAEQDPQTCWATNVEPVRVLLRQCRESGAAPWLIFVSSREVYGDADELPVSEGAALKPMNVYAHSKCEGERLVQSAVGSGLIANICRLSNVYGWAHDHPDRVVMAFAGAAAKGGTMNVEGAANTLDFTEVHDVAEGVWRLAETCMRAEVLPPIHFVSGRGITLRQLAELAAARALEPVTIKEAAPRSFDVSRFVGDPRRAERLLGWKATTRVEDGVARLIAQLAQLPEHQQSTGAGGFALAPES